MRADKKTVSNSRGRLIHLGSLSCAQVLIPRGELTPEWLTSVSSRMASSRIKLLKLQHENDNTVCMLPPFATRSCARGWPLRAPCVFVCVRVPVRVWVCMCVCGWVSE